MIDSLEEPGDVLVALSTSGNSANCVATAEVMKKAKRVRRGDGSNFMFQ